MARAFFRRQNAVSADDLAGIVVAHHQMLTIRIVDILINPGHLAGQTSAEFLGKNTVAQLLCGKNFPLIECDSDRKRRPGGLVASNFTGDMYTHVFLLINRAEER